MRLELRVKPNARASRLWQAQDGQWHAELKAAPVDGKANEELIALVAAHFGLRKAEVMIKRGASGRMKVLELPEGTSSR